MARSIKNRLEALEGAAHSAPDEGGQGHSEQMAQIAACERQACLISAWVLHHGHAQSPGEPIDSVLPKMLRYVDKAEALRLLAMDYNSVYRAIGMPTSRPRNGLGK